MYFGQLWKYHSVAPRYLQSKINTWLSFHLVLSQISLMLLFLFSVLNCIYNYRDFLSQHPLISFSENDWMLTFEIGLYFLSSWGGIIQLNDVVSTDQLIPILIYFLYLSKENYRYVIYQFQQVSILVEATWLSIIICNKRIIKFVINFSWLCSS